MSTPSVAPQWTGFDVIKGMLAFLHSDRIPARSPILHTALHRLSRKPKYSAMLAGYVFDRRNYFPFSKAFQTDLVNLEQAGHLSTRNPDLVEFERTKKLGKTFDLYGRDLFSRSELQTLRALAHDFSVQVNSVQA